MDNNAVTYIFMIVLLVLMVVFMGRASKKQTAQYKEREDWRKQLKPGDKVATQSGLLGEVVEVLPDYDEIIIKSEDSLSRWRLAAVIQPPVRPAYVPDEDEDSEESGDSAAPASIEGAPSDTAQENAADDSETVDSDDKDAQAKA
ncbi:MAG: preprotein translocase subunit YajC [Pseudoscardovia radai]|nr:preprotein translocase subunit YajC [Pseudoscardovia radai]